MFLSKFSQTKTNTGSFVLYPDQGKSSGSPFRNTAANQCGGSGSVGIISLDPDPYKKSLDPESGSVSNYTDSPHCCQLFVRVGHCVLLRSARNVLKRNVLFFEFFAKSLQSTQHSFGFHKLQKIRKKNIKVL